MQSFRSAVPFRSGNYKDPIEQREHFHRVFINEVIRQWRPRLRACIRARGEHFEHTLQLCLIFVH